MAQPTKLNFPPEILELDQRIGEFMEYWGFKRIHGRVWLHLFVSDSPLDVAELMKRLNVSKALMSLCLRDLKEFSVILEDGVAKHGTVLYRANPDLFAVIQNVLRTRERPLLGRIKSAQQIASSIPETELAAHRLSAGRIDELGHLVGGADRALLALVRMPAGAGSPGEGLLGMLSLMGGAEDD